MVGAGESEESVGLQRQQMMQQWERQQRANQSAGVKPRMNNVGSLKKLPGRPKDPPAPVQALAVETVPANVSVETGPTPEEREASYRHTRLLIVAVIVAVLFVLWIKQRIRP